MIPRGTSTPSCHRFRVGPPGHAVSSACALGMRRGTVAPESSHAGRPPTAVHGPLCSRGAQFRFARRPRLNEAPPGRGASRRSGSNWRQSGTPNLPERVPNAAFQQRTGVSRPVGRWPECKSPVDTLSRLALRSTLWSSAFDTPDCGSSSRPARVGRCSRTCSNAAEGRWTRSMRQRRSQT